MLPLFQNGNLKTLIGAGGILLTLGAGYGFMQSNINLLSNRVIALEQVVNEAKTNPNSSAVGSLLQTEILEINRRLDRIESKQDVILTVLRPK